jgi:hypothetical protein
MNRFLLPLLAALCAPAQVLAAPVEAVPAARFASPEAAHKYLRAALEPLPIPRGESAEALPAPLLSTIEASQPQSGQALLEIIADKKSALHRRAVNAFVAAWQSMSGEQIVQYFSLQMEPQSRLRSRYPEAFEASGQVSYGLGYGWGGRVRDFPIRVRSEFFVDGKPFGEARSYSTDGEPAASGSVKTSGLAPGAHTAALSLDFAFEHGGATHRGRLRSPNYTFAIVDADSPDDLEVVKDDAARARVEKALVPTGPYAATLSGRSAAQGRYGLGVPGWALNDSLPFALCFDVEFHEGGKVYAGGPLSLPAGRGYTGAFNLQDIDKFIAGRAGRVPVKVVLRPSYHQALSDSEIKSFYGGTLEFDNLHVDIVRPPGWAAPADPQLARP